MTLIFKLTLESQVHPALRHSRDNVQTDKQQDAGGGENINSLAIAVDNK